MDVSEGTDDKISEFKYCWKVLFYLSIFLHFTLSLNVPKSIVNQILAELILFRFTSLVRFQTKKKKS